MNPYYRNSPPHTTAPPAANLTEMTSDLKNHIALCEEILALVERENQVLRRPEPTDIQPLIAIKKSLLPRLSHSLDRLRHHRQRWLQLPPSDRARQPDIPPLMRRNQDLIMKTIVLDRENEQILLRRGLVPPQHLPPSQRQRPNFVSELYRRQGT